MARYGFVIDLKSRRVEVTGIVHQPYEEWMKQIARNLIDWVDGEIFVFNHAGVFDHAGVRLQARVLDRGHIRFAGRVIRAGE